MFTGLIEKKGRIKARTIKNNMCRITFDVDGLWNDLVLGESIAVNGVCLTVADFTANSFSADISLPTMKDTTLAGYSLRRELNFERSMKLGGRLGGHIVQGHVDGVGKIISFTKRNDNLIIKISTEYKLHKLIAPKASITVDGVSLTIQDLESRCFTIVIIPHSAEHTNLHMLRVGEKVNIEIDVLAKYVKHFLSS